MKSVMKSVAHSRLVREGDLSGVRELAKKAGYNLASSTASVARAAIGADLVDADMKSAVEAASNDITSGKVKVHDYMSDSACPAS